MMQLCGCDGADFTKGAVADATSATGSVASILALPRNVCFTALSDDKADVTGQFRANS